MAKETEPGRAALNHVQQVIAAVAHDFRAPARQMKSFGQLLDAQVGDSLDREPREYLELIGAAADALLLKIDSLTRLSQVWSADFAPRPVVLGSAVSEALANVETLGAKHLDGVSGTDLTSVVMADRDLLVSLLAELIVNAIKFGASPVSVEITATDRERRCAISVIDSGPGFDAKDPVAAFQLFKRFHDSNYPGTGTGLSMVQAILERHRSQATIESASARGTTVQFELDLAEDRETPASNSK